MTRQQARPKTDAERDARRTTLYDGCLLALAAIATLIVVWLALVVVLTW